MAAFALQGVQRQGRSSAVSGGAAAAGMEAQEQEQEFGRRSAGGERGNDMRGLEALVAAASREDGGVGSRG